MTTSVPLFPFSAIAGQEALKRALVLNAVDPSIGGALIRGDKGTAKSTAVRALAALLPPIPVVAGCPFRCAPGDPATACPWCAERAAGGEPRQTELGPVPLVELPVAATEDRVAGSFDLEAAIRHGRRRFEPGLLASANRGVLYVDEVNLLPDHLVDVILDAAASGTHRVEREGVSVVHPARFVLVGTMNPEEGDLRPQLLDRFGLVAEVATTRDPAARATIVRRRIAFDADPSAFAATWAPEDRRLGERIRDATARLPRVEVGDELLDLITRICVAYEVDGLRADIVIYKGAAALAALDGRDRATEEDVREAALLALPHRRRRDPFDDSGFDPEPLDQLTAAFRTSSPDGINPLAEGAPGARGADTRLRPRTPPLPEGAGNPAGANPRRRSGTPGDPIDPGDRPPPGGAAGPGDRPPTEWPPPGGGGGTPVPPQEKDSHPVMPYGSLPSPSGRTHTWGRAGRSLAGSAQQGHHVGSAPPQGRVRSLAFDATLRAASPHQVTRESNGLAIHLRPSDLREKVLEGRPGRLLLFVVDASGSMSARRRLALARGTVRVLLLDAYRRRDRVGLIAFGGAGARLVLPPTSSVDLAERRLSHLTTGGRTPLAEALDLAYLTLARWPLSGAPVLVLVSDGRANSAPPGVDPWWASIGAAGRLKRAGIATAVVDADRGGDRLGLTQALATALGASVLRPRAPAEVAAPALAARVRRLAVGAEVGRIAPAARWC